MNKDELQLGYDKLEAGESVIIESKKEAWLLSSYSWSQGLNTTVLKDEVFGHVVKANWLYHSELIERISKDYPEVNYLLSLHEEMIAERRNM